MKKKEGMTPSELCRHFMGDSGVRWFQRAFMVAGGCALLGLGLEGVYPGAGPIGMTAMMVVILGWAISLLFRD